MILALSGGRFPIVTADTGCTDAYMVEFRELP